MRIWRKALSFLATLALTAGLFGVGASVVTASHSPICTGTPYVWFYSQAYGQNGGDYDEIKFCYGSYPSPGFTDLKVSGGGPATTPPERCEGLFAFHDGNFDDCLTGLFASSSGWGNGKTLCVYVNTFYNKNEGWAYINSNIGSGNLGSSLNDKISSVRWVSGGSAAC